MTSDLWMPLVFDVLVGGRARDGEADDEDVGLRIGQRPEPVILLLPRCVPQVQTDDPAVHRHLNAPHVSLHITVTFEILRTKSMFRDKSEDPVNGTNLKHTSTK